MNQMDRILVHVGSYYYYASLNAKRGRVKRDIRTHAIVIADMKR